MCKIKEINLCMFDKCSITILYNYQRIDTGNIEQNKNINKNY